MRMDISIRTICRSIDCACKGGMQHSYFESFGNRRTLLAKQTLHIINARKKNGENGGIWPKKIKRFKINPDENMDKDALDKGILIKEADAHPAALYVEHVIMQGKEKSYPYPKNC